MWIDEAIQMLGRCHPDVDGKPKVQVQGAGIFLDPPALPPTPPVTVRVKNTRIAECWEPVCGTADENEPAQLEAKSE